MAEILAGLCECWQNKKRAVLATIIEVEGSAYRREGARCLLLEDGRILGTLSGGCVEGDLFEHAQHVMETGYPKKIRYDFRASGDLLWGLGVGCNGAITLWLQPFDPDRQPQQAEMMVRSFERRASCNRMYMTGLVLESQDPTRIPVGTELVFTAGGRVQPGGWPPGIEDTVVDGVSVRLFLETVTPLSRLVVFGGGPDAVPLVRMAKMVHWHTTVVDHRQEFVAQEKFPEADERVVIGRHAYADFPVGEDDYVVVMTHNYEIDRLLIKKLLACPIPYLGVLGSRDRMDRILREYAETGEKFSKEALEKLHAPVGLDIGAESPEEIALSIMAELVSRKNGRNGQSLRWRKGTVHVRKDGTSYMSRLSSVIT